MPNVNQTPWNQPGGSAVTPEDVQLYIYYFKESATIEQYYPTSALIGFGYHNATTLKIFFRGAQDVNAKDEVRLTVAAGTSLSDAAQWILTAPAYKQVAPSFHMLLNTCVFGGTPVSFRPEFLSCTISYGACCTGGGGGGTMSNWILSDGSTLQQIDNAETVTFADGTFINNVVSATNTVTTDLSAINGTSDATTRFLSKDNTWDVPTYTTYSAMTTSTLGLGRLRYALGATPAANVQTTTAGKTYGITANASDQLVVNVPWSGGGDAFTTIVPISGTSPVASGADTLNLVSTNSTVGIDGTVGTDTIDFSSRRFESFVVTMTDEKRPITTGVKYEFRIPYNFTVSWYGIDPTDEVGCKAPIKIMVNIPPSGGEEVGLIVNVEVSINDRVTWNSLFDVKTTIDDSEWSSVTAATRMQLAGGDPASFSLSCDDVLRFTVDTVVGSPIGLKCVILGYQASIV
jgi:hypothetical protein